MENNNYHNLLFCSFVVVTKPKLKSKARQTRIFIYNILILNYTSCIFLAVFGYKTVLEATYSIYTLCHKPVFFHRWSDG